MEQLEAKAEEHTKGIELRCKGWCHSNDGTQPAYEVKTPETKYFLN